MRGGSFHHLQFGQFGEFGQQGSSPTQPKATTSLWSVARGLDALDDADAEFGMFDALAHSVVTADGHRRPTGTPPSTACRTPTRRMPSVEGRGVWTRPDRVCRAGRAPAAGAGEAPGRTHLAVGGTPAETAAPAAEAALLAAVIAARTVGLPFLLEAVVEAAAQFVDGRGACAVLRAARTLLAGVEVGADIFGVDLAQETARTRELHIAPLEAHLGIGDRRLDLGTRQGHIEQAALLMPSGDSAARCEGKRFSSRPTI